MEVQGSTHLWLSGIRVQLVPAMSSVACIQSSVTVWVNRVDRSAGRDAISSQATSAPAWRLIQAGRREGTPTNL